MAEANDGEDLVYGGVGWEGAVEDVELSLQPLWNIIPASSWLNHGSQKLKTYRNKLFGKYYCVKYQLLQLLNLNDLEYYPPAYQQCW